MQHRYFSHADVSNSIFNCKSFTELLRVLQSEEILPHPLLTYKLVYATARLSRKTSAVKNPDVE